MYEPEESSSKPYIIYQMVVTSEGAATISVRSTRTEKEPPAT